MDDPHLPDISSVEDLLAVVSACIYVEFSWIVTGKYYLKKISTETVKEVVEARRCARELLDWIQRAATITPTGHEDAISFLDDVYHPMVIQQLCCYKAELEVAVRNKLGSYLHITPSQFVGRIEEGMRPALVELWNAGQPSENANYSWDYLPVLGQSPSISLNSSIEFGKVEFSFPRS